MILDHLVSFMPLLLALETSPGRKLGEEEQQIGKGKHWRYREEAHLAGRLTGLDNNLVCKCPTFLRSSVPLVYEEEKRGIVALSSEGRKEGGED